MKPVIYFVFFFALVDVLQDRKICCLQSRLSIFQPGNLTGWSSEGVNEIFKNKMEAHLTSDIRTMTRTSSATFLSALSTINRNHGNVRNNGRISLESEIITEH